MKANVISLKNSNRRAMAIQRSKKINFEVEFFDAINVYEDKAIKKNYTQIDSKKFETRYGRKQTDTELGCLLSHCFLYKYLAQQKNGFHLILEDDFIPLINRIDFKIIIDFIISKKPDVAILGYSKVDNNLEKGINLSNPLMNKIKIGDSRYHYGKRCVETTCGAVAYLVSPRFLRIVSEIEEYGRLADDWAYYESLGLDVVHVSPLCFFEDYKKMESYIEHERSIVTKEKRQFLPNILLPVWRCILGIYRRYKFIFKKNNQT